MSNESTLHIIPPWAQKELGPKPEPQDHSTELLLLREFHDAWEHAHSEANMERRLRDATRIAKANDRLINAANMLRRFRNPGQLDALMAAHGT